MEEGIKSSTDKLKAVKNAPPPSSVYELRHSKPIVNYLHLNWPCALIVNDSLGVDKKPGALVPSSLRQTWMGSTVSSPTPAER